MKISLRKWVLVSLGFLSLGVGLLGIFLPLLPTTIFLLMAAACFARSSERLYHWLLNHKLFGPYIKNWRQHKAITRRTKIVILVLLWGTLSSSAVFAVEELVIRFLLLIIGLGVTVFILRVKTLKPDIASERR